MLTPVISYRRVSTDRQGVSGLGLEAQRAAVEEYARSAGLSVIADHVEVESGRRRDRPVLALAIAQARAVNGVLAVAKMDRLARDARMILEIVDSGIRVVFLDIPQSGDPILGRLLLTVMAAFAEFEARRIAQRIREAMAALKARHGKATWFRQNLTDEIRRRAAPLGGEAMRRKTAAFRAIVRPVAVGLRAEGRTLADVAAELNARGYATFRGRPWTVATVDALARAPG